MIQRFKIPCKVISLEERKLTTRIRKEGDETIQETESLGWFLTLRPEGANLDYSFALGDTKPKGIEKNSAADLIIEHRTEDKADDTKTSSFSPDFSNLELQAAVEAAKDHKMSLEEIEAQRQSWARQDMD